MSHTQNYIDLLQREYRTNVALEHSYRTPIKTYFETLHPHLQAGNEQKRIKNIGAPDIVVYKERKGEQIPFGYIETKDINFNLDKVEKSEQMERYLDLDNLILTNYLEFRFYLYGEKVATVTIGEADNSIKGIPENYARLESLLNDFADFEGQTITSPEDLAEAMAKKANLMRHVFYETLRDVEPSSLKDQLADFQNMLVRDMDAEQFADVYAQTIAYGLFTARLHDTTLHDFSRGEARDLVPETNPFLRKLFDYVCGADLEKRVVWIVDALCEIFLATNMQDILKGFGKKTSSEDAIIHFYETFLNKYDPTTRKSRGVWYTPQPIVNFIVRAIDEVLQTHFNLKAGIADSSKVKITTEDGAQEMVHRVQMLDVATGTGTFTAEAIRQIHAKMQHNMGMWNSYVEADLLPRLHGFEILMASYAMCHVKIDLLLEELGYKRSKNQEPQRLHVYLTNALEEHKPPQQGSFFTRALANEANEANRIKRDLPIMVAYGNPPYNVSSQNRNSWIDKLIAPYKAGLNEKNINPLSDDYIKFIRNAEYYIAKNGGGVMAMITNNSYLDGIIHRQMRLHLLQTFDEIYIYDLHGSAKKKERSPDGTPDKNVFDIQQGVSIIIAVKHNGNVIPAKAGIQKNTKLDSRLRGSDGEKPLATLHHYSSYGARKAKYAALMQHSLKNTPWQTLKPHAPHFFFAPKDFTGNVEYEAGFALNELFVVNASGITTERDHLTIHKKLEDLEKTIAELKQFKVEDFRYKYREKKDGRDWKISTAQDDLKNNKGVYTMIDYRPFEQRHTYYTGKTKGFMAYPRNNIMSHMLGENTALLLMRSLFDAKELNTVFLSKNIIDKNFYGFQTYCFPLYTYDEIKKGADDDLLGDLLPRKPNFHPEIIKQIAKKLRLKFVADHELPSDDKSFNPLNLLDYIYATLHSPVYRNTYKEFLKIDFPRIPYPDDAGKFWQLVTLGGELRALHLLEHEALDEIMVGYPKTETDTNIIEKVEYVDGKVFINKTQHFNNVLEIAWNFTIGGYNPAQKWLKDRKGEKLTIADVNYYGRIIIALTKTHELMQEIDEVA